jgi:FMN phosphatase YigB (HAD superfamily)
LIRGIVFDLFDTLVDQNHHRLPSIEFEGRRMSATTPRLHRHATTACGLSLSLGEFADLQREVDRSLYRETLKQGIELPTLRRFEALVHRLGLESRSELPADFTEIHMGMLRDAVGVPDHHEAVLASLAVDHRLAICSNFSHGETARLILDEARFSAHLSSVVISDDVGFRKPRPEIFEEVARALELAPSEILHVGDSLEADVAGAAACGMQTVWLTRQVADPDSKLEAYDGPPPDFALEDLLDLPVLAARLSV